MEDGKSERTAAKIDFAAELAKLPPAEIKKLAAAGKWVLAGIEKAIASPAFAEAVEGITSGRWQQSAFLAVAGEALEKGGLSEAHEREIRETAARLQSDYEKLLAINLAFQDRAIISQLTVEAFSLGRLCSDKISDGTLAEFRTVLQAQAALAREAMRAKTAALNTRIKRAILVTAGRGRETCKQPYKLAVEIMDGVNERIARGGYSATLKKDAIAKRIIKLKNERRLKGVA
jgi:hypothetical protein